MSMRDDRYRPRTFTDDPGPDPVSLINEPAPPENVSTLVRPKPRSLHAVLCEALTNTQHFGTTFALVHDRLEVGRCRELRHVPQ